MRQFFRSHELEQSATFVKRSAIRTGRSFHYCSELLFDGRCDANGHRSTMPTIDGACVCEELWLNVPLERRLKNKPNTEKRNEPRRQDGATALISGHVICPFASAKSRLRQSTERNRSAFTWIRGNRICSDKEMRLKPSVGVGSTSTC
jgi:hypothetical protein